MKKSVIWIIAVVVFAAVIVGVSLLYNKLASDFEQDPFADIKNTDAQSDLPSESVPEVDEPESENKPDVNLAPDFTVYDENGNEVKLSDFFGKPIVLNFWASWCYYCKVEMPDFNEAYKNNPDVVFLMVNATGMNGETVADAKKYIADSGYEFPIYYDLDYDAINTYGVTGFPISFFFNADGELVTYAPGMLSASQLEQGINIIK